jgi:hypothetical protein
MYDSEKLNDYRSEVEKRAYELYMQRGATDGNDLEDWLIAEREIAARARRERTGLEVPIAKANVKTRIVESSR